MKFTHDDNNDEEPAHKLGRVKKSQKNQPNHFVSIPIQNSDLLKNMFKLNCDLLDVNQKVEDYLVPSTSCHLTLCTLRIDNDADLIKVRDILDKVLRSDQIMKYFPITLDFEDISEFYNKVLYVKSNCIAEVEKLDDIRKELLKEFDDACVNTAGNYFDFVPHLTVFKVSKAKNTISDDSVMTLMNESVWQNYKDFKFGSEKINELQLCKMTRNIMALKTYPIEHSVKIKI